MVRLAHYMGIVHPGCAFEVSTTSIQVHMIDLRHFLLNTFFKKFREEAEQLGGKLPLHLPYR